jgi:Na+-transporting NADH:ubiquinone oxidoreductase subunit C
MKRNLKMIVFVVVLGLVTSLLLLGMDVLTRDRIIANEQALLKSSILDGFGIAYNFNNIHDVFDEKVEIDNSVEGFTFYIDPITNYVAFEFEGDGVWGPIKGVITLKSDFETIVRITILEQQETPGLGGVVAERNYLNKFVDKVMNIRLTKTPTDPLSDVEMITGGTRTSERFDTLLNLAYDLHRAAWESRIGG